MPSPSVESATSTLPTESAPTPTPDPVATSAPAPSTAPQAPAISALPAALEDDVRDCERYEEDWMTNGHLYECLKGSRVRRLQEALIRWNTGVALEADGYLGATTQRALLTWQFQRGWPAPTTTLEKYRTIERLVLVDPSAPGVDVAGPCPVWIDTEVTAESLGSRPNDLWPILQLCDQGKPSATSSSSSPQPASRSRRTAATGSTWRGPSPPTRRSCTASRAPATPCTSTPSPRSGRERLAPPALAGRRHPVSAGGRGTAAPRWPTRGATGGRCRWLRPRHPRRRSWRGIG